LLYDWSVKVAASPPGHRPEMPNKLTQPSVIAEFLESLQYQKCYIFSSVHRNSTLKKSNKKRLYAGIYLQLNYSTCFGRPSRPSGVHKTVVAACGTDHTVWVASFFKCEQIRTYLVTFEEALSPDSMICTTGCNYSFMYS